MEGQIRVETKEGYTLYDANVWTLFLSQVMMKRIIVDCNPMLTDHVRIFIDDIEIPMPEEMKDDE